MEFLYPQVLYALFAVSIPIVIHLFNFRRYQKVWFNNVELLKTIQKKTKKHSQLKQLLVLLLRILTIVALVLAFASPYLPNKDSSENLLKQEYVSIYLDNSYSMTHMGENGSLLNEAQNMALSIVNSYKNTDRFQLITNQMDARYFRWFNQMEMIQNVMEVEAVHQQKDLAGIFQREKMLRMQQQPPISNATLYLLSDFQKNLAFNTDLQPDTNLLVRFIPLQNNPVNNLSIDTLFFTDPVQLPYSLSNLVVKLSNNGNEDQNSIPLRLFVNEEQKAILSVDLPAGQSKEFQLSFTNTTSGMMRAKVEIDDYPIVYDDQLYFTFNVREEFNVAIISNTETNPFLKKLYSEDSLIQLQTYFQHNVDYKSLGQQDFVILDEMNTLSTGLQNELENYIKNGGSVLLVPGSEIDYNSWLSRMQAPRYGTLNKHATILNKVDKQQLFFNRVFESQWANESKNQKIDLPRIHQFFTIIPTESSSHLLQSRSGDDILTQTTFGQGNIYQLAFPLRKEYSELPEHALFVAVFNQMVLLSDKQERSYEILGSGKPLIIRGLGASIRGGDQVPELKMGEIQWIPQISFNRSSELVISQLEWPEDGFASLIYIGKQEKVIAVNYNRNESDFDVWSKDELSNIIAEGNWPGFQIIDSSPQKITADLIELNESKQLWRWFLVLSIFFIFVEAIILRYWK